jgi:iron complex transport system substrate-binding protein
MRTKVFSLMLLVILIGCAGCNSQTAATTQAIGATTQAASPVTPTVPMSPDSTGTLTPVNTVAVIPTEGGGFTITDALGREITFKKSPERIVLAGKALFMLADAIYTFPDAGKKIVALSNTQQGSYTFIPMIDPTFDQKIGLASSASAEDIAAANPDCVILKSSNAETLGTPLEALNIPVVYLDFESPEQYQTDLAILGVLFQNTQRASEVAAFFQNKVDSITSTLSSLTDDQKPKTLLLYYSTKNDTISFNVPPLSWIQTYMVETAGGTPVWTDANPGNGWTQVNLEQIAAWNPEDIFIVSYSSPVNDVLSLIKADSQWQALDAVKNDKIYGFATDVYSWDQADTRWILGLTWMAEKLHPDLFPNQDILQEARTFYFDLYGMDSTSFEQNIVPILTGSIP